MSAKVFSFIIALYNVYFNRFWPKWGRVDSAIGAAIGKTLGFLRFVRKIGNVSKNGGNVSSSYSQKKRAESCGL
jgi:hypothetical protein